MLLLLLLTTTTTTTTTATTVALLLLNFIVGACNDPCATAEPDFSLEEDFSSLHLSSSSSCNTNPSKQQDMFLLPIDQSLQ